MDLNSIGRAVSTRKKSVKSATKLRLKIRPRHRGRELAEYRHSLNKKRCELSRSVMSELILGIDDMPLHGKNHPEKPNPERKIKKPEWKKLKSPDRRGGKRFR